MHIKFNIKPEKLMRYFSVILTVLFFSNCSLSSDTPKNKKDPAITKSEIKDHITYLASDELKGRFTGGEELKQAADYIKSDFESSGLQPFFNGSYFQEYPFIDGLELSGKNKIKFTVNGKELNLEPEKDFIPAPMSGSSEFSGEMVFTGYSIDAKDLDYNDFDSIDVKGKIVIALRYNPDIENPHSKFDNYSELRYKAKTAQDKGAAGIIFVNGYVPKDDEDKLVKLKYDSAPLMKDFPAVHVKREFIEKIFAAEKMDFKKVQGIINASKKPASFIIKNSSITLSTEVKQVEKKSWNVAGYLPGNDTLLKDEYIIIGGHFDHLGMGETGSLYRGTEPQIHNGADDNASGTTGVLEIAEKFASEKISLKRSIIFVTFSGEELGLLGSDYFVKNLSVPYKKIAAMINMDMIGRMNDENSLIVYGTGTSSGWKDVLNNANKDFNFKLAFNQEGYGPSDHSSFYAKEIPVLFFFTGTHTDYHRPTDDADKINFEKEEQILKYVASISYVIDTTISKPDYVNVPRKDTGGAMRFKVYVGTIPDYSAQVDGFRINGVSEGSPAQKGGLKAGDIIIDFGGKKISNIYDYMYAMNSYAPGDTVEIMVKRGDEQIKLKLELAAR